MDASGTFEFRILGPVEVASESGRVRLGGRKQRALLGLLLVHAREVVSSDRLVEALWGPRPPKTAATSLRNLVTQLRSALGADIIVTQPPGYVLMVDGDRLDLRRFEALVAEARRAEPSERAATLREALALWRGPPLADLAFEPFAQDEIRRLEELRLEALEERVDADLALGRSGELVPELESLVADYPLRERLRALLMLALYRAHRQAEAVEAYHDARRTLNEELGIDPSPMLHELFGSILRQEPALEPSSHGQTLPIQPTPFVGRAREVADVVALLRRDDVRLLTLTGAGGSGKTRLAVQAALEVEAEVRDGVRWVPLAPLRDPTLVLDTVAQALETQRDLAVHIGEKRMLLLLDNFEHVLVAGPGVAELVSRCPNLNVLVTSREPLHLAGEREYLVPTLSVLEAVELFAERAHVAEPAEAVLEICRRLDCLPLAIELAAARTRVLPPELLLARLDKRLPLLTGGPHDAPERQRTLEATIAWSYDLLGNAEKRLFARLAVFASGCTLEAAEQVCDADLDTLQSLVEKNLVRPDEERYVMLETVREYALERLAAREELGPMMRGLAEHLLALAASRKPADSLAVVEPLTAELDNLRAAVAWTLEAPEPELALRLASAVRWFSSRGSRVLAEQSRWLEEALRAGGSASPNARAQALETAARIALILGDYPRSTLLAEQSVDLHRELHDDRSSVESLVVLVGATSGSGDFSRAKTACEELLEVTKRLSDTKQLHRAMHILGEVELRLGNLNRASELMERSADYARNSEDGLFLANSLHGLGDVALKARDAQRAADCYGESLSLYRAASIWTPVAYCVGGLAAAAALAGDTRRAGRLWGALDLLEEESDGPLNDPERAVYEGLITVRANEAPATFEAAVAQGRAMTVDEAVDYALAATA